MLVDCSALYVKAWGGGDILRHCQIKYVLMSVRVATSTEGKKSLEMRNSDAFSLATFFFA